MPVYKHIAAQQKKQERADKLRAQKRRRGEDDQGLATSTVVGWSDEDSDDDEEEEDDDDEDSEGSEEDEDEDDDDEDEEMASGADGSGDDSDDEGLVMDANDPTVPRKPPSGFPTAVEALSDPIASSVNLLPADERPASASKKAGEDDDTERKEEEDEELPLVCVVCPNKVLKKGKMVQVHLGSKDHLRRLARFRAHLESADCPASHKTADARWVSSELDRQVFERLSRQTEVGGKKAGTTKEVGEKDVAAKDKGKGKASASAAATVDTTPARPLKRKADAVSKADADGTSVREQIRLQKKDKYQRRKEAKREKAERIKAKKAQQGGQEEAAEEGAIKMALPPSSHASKPKRRFIEKAKPTAEEIQLRQEWKEKRRLAREAGLAEPPKPLLAYEYGGNLDNVPKTVRNRYEKMQAAYEKGEKAKPPPAAQSKKASKAAAKEEKRGADGKQGKGQGQGAAAAVATGPSPKAAKRKEKKERRKSESGAAEMLPEV